jgi:hypothetical protein
MSESLSAVASASEAVEAVANAPETISKLFDTAKRVVYGTSYTIAYVIVFPGALLFAVVPKRNVLVQGFLDGSKAAQAKAEEMIG